MERLTERYKQHGEVSCKENPCTAEPPNKGHFGANSFVLCREVIPISEVN